MNDFLTCFPSYNVPLPRPLRNENIASFFHPNHFTFTIILYNP